MKQEDAEHKSVKHVSKVEIKTFSDAVTERDNRNVGVTQKYTYTEWTEGKDGSLGRAGIPGRAGMAAMNLIERAGLEQACGLCARQGCLNCTCD